ncbi:MAG: TonB-dependent receptor, partial [Verrucomicrobia bacterium]|nr:TonB-dependent receptor [Verrucomicrobiota bacterium]
TAGLSARRDFDLTSSVYLLDVFRVAGEREGNAAAVTLQRNADNLKNVVAMDAYGNLPNLSAIELAIRMPGVTFGNPSDEVAETVSVRGMGQGMSTITIDGGLMSSWGAQSRNTRMTAFTGAMFEGLEVIKGHTPDKGVDSLGGTVNIKTRSPLSMRERRRITYTASVSGIPSGTDQIPMREQHRWHPLFNVAWLQKFKTPGSGQDNLAVSANFFYSENVFGFFRTVRDYQQTNSVPAYLWDYSTQDQYAVRVQKSLNTKWDYRVSDNSLLKVNVIVSDTPEPFRPSYQTRAFAGSATTVPSATTGIVPGAFDRRITVVRANAPAATATAATTPTAAIDAISRFIHRLQDLRHIDLAGEHRLGAFEYDWAGLYSVTRYRWGPKEISLTNRIGGVPVIGPNGQPGTGLNTMVAPNGERGVGWILDRTASDAYPRFVQNGGLDFTVPGNYRPTQNGLSSQAGDIQPHKVRDLRGNIKYRLPVESITAYLKTGGQVREQTTSTLPVRRRWSYLGREALPSDTSVMTWDRLRTGRAIPQWTPLQFTENGRPKEPSLWQEDLYFHESSRYSAFNHVRETVYATYLMTQGKFGRNGFVAGVRGETTDTVASSYVRSRVPSTPAEQAADPVGAARRDYAGNYRERAGRYTNYFPSIHLNRDFLPNLKGRLSWSTSMGRPSMANAVPRETPNESARTLTIGNPALLPQTAKTWDASLEYYFEPSGSVSAGWFHKRIRDYIVNNVNVGVIGGGKDNGYLGEYEGFTQLTASNAGNAIAQGWEFNYLQQFTFLPGWLRGLSFNGNMTILNAHGDFGSAGAYRDKDQVPGFIPYSGNASLSWKYRRFGTRVLYSYTSYHIRTFNES